MKLRATRTVAKRKSYAELQRIGSSDEDEAIQEPDDDESDEVVIAEDDDAEEDEDEEEEDDLLAEEASDDDASNLGEESGEETDGGGEGTPGPAKGRKRRSIGIIAPDNYHDAPRYPQDPRFFYRIWTGPLRRYAKYKPLRNALYGPEWSGVQTIWELDTRWTNLPLLPAKYPPEHRYGVVPSPWVPENHEIDQLKNSILWYHKNQDAAWEQQRSHPSERHIGQRFVPRAEGDLVAFLGPWDKQEEFKMEQGKPNFLSHSGRPELDSDPESPGPAGWMVDVGGLVLAMGWQPTTTGDEQLLAIATVPHSDQDYIAPDDPRQDEKSGVGSIQFWEVVGTRSENELPSPSLKLPRFVGAICFDWGRPTRIQWCPVSLTVAGIAGRLAVLCRDGKARVLDITNFPTSDTPTYDWIDSPIATLGCDDEDNVLVTCLTWINVNCIALGHSDGSISVWSIQPRQLLQRHYLQSSFIIDICSGYPSRPNLICAVPVGGTLTLVDLDHATTEMTFFAIPVVNFQPNLVVWNEIMQGFLVQYGTHHGSISVSFLHARFFCQARNVINCPTSLMCISSGATHPYILVGCADGSLWSFNALAKLFCQKHEKTHKLKILEHEYRPIKAEAPAWHPSYTGPRGSNQAPALRAAVRILQGYQAEENNDPLQEARKETEKKKKGSAKAKGKPKSGRPPKLANEDEKGGDGGFPMDPIMNRSVIHEPLTRITTVAWNPNLDFSCWAACSFGSGLVRIMDLGVR